MSRFRLYPTTQQAVALAQHCAHARYVWNLAVEQLAYRGRGRRMPGYAEQNQQLTEARAAFGWSLFATRLEQKAPGRVEKVNPAFTSQRCSACGYVARESRESQALFRCVACGHTSNADLNAARDIAAGHAVTARGAPVLAGAMNREPQHAPSLVA